MLPTENIFYGRISYPHVWKPTKTLDGKDVYQLDLLIPKTDAKQIEAIKKAIALAIDIAKKKFNGILPGGFKLPQLKDGDARNAELQAKGKAIDPAYTNHVYFTARSEQKPEIRNQKNQPVLRESDVYGGCYCNVAVNIAPYGLKVGSKFTGASFFLEAIQKVKDGEAFGVRATPVEALFSEVVDADDDI